MEIQYEDLMHRLEELGDLIHEKKTGDFRPDILGAKFTMGSSSKPPSLNDGGSRFV